MERKKRENGEAGYIVVETVGAFMLFVMLIVSILSLVNIVTLQARVHYALTQTANTLSMYGYVFHLLGMADTMQTIDAKANVVSEEVNGMIGNINGVIDGLKTASLNSAVKHGEDAVSGAAAWGEAFSEDPASIMQYIANYGINEVKNQLFELIARPLVGRFLTNGEMTGDEYLESVNVINSRSGQTGLKALEFHQWGNIGEGNSAFIDRNGNVKLTVSYEVEYTFGVLKLPFNPTLKITQTAVTKAWLGGSGKGYTK